MPHIDSKQEWPEDLILRATGLLCATELQARVNVFENVFRSFMLTWR